MALCGYNGDLIDDQDLKLDPADRGLTLGDGVFDTLVMRDGALVDGEAHFFRLQRHAAILNISCPWSAGQLSALAHRLTTEDAVIRTQLTRGPGARGLSLPENPQPTLIMRALPLPPRRSPPQVMISTIRRNETSPLARIKSTNYLDNILALKEAQDNDCDDALFFNTHQHLCCATTANVFIVKDGQWLTPPLDDGVLDGITRARVIVEKNAREENITLGKLHAADEIWLTNSLIGLLKTSGLKA